MENLILLCAAAAAAGAINAVAGGGTLLTFPALLAALGSASASSNVVANATSTTALVPGSLAGAWAYRQELGRLPRWSLVLTIPSLIGGVIGSLLVVNWPEAFKTLVPWLILTAAALFALQPHIARWTGVGSPHPDHRARQIALALVLQFLVSIYGGYFGAGAGIVMLSILGFMGLNDIHEMNALKSLLGSLINGVSVVIFAAYGRIDWRLTAYMAVAAVLGGYFGARIARRLSRILVRGAVVGIGFTLATYYFYRQFQG